MSIYSINSSSIVLFTAYYCNFIIKVIYIDISM